MSPQVKLPDGWEKDGPRLSKTIDGNDWVIQCTAEDRIRILVNDFILRSFLPISMHGESADEIMAQEAQRIEKDPEGYRQSDW